MKQQLTMVKEFMRAFGQDVPGELIFPDPAVRELRGKLNVEEGKELGDADGLVAYFDAILDSLYVTHGAAAAAGITAEQLKAGFAEVHRSNMTKLWTAQEVEDYQRDFDGEPASRYSFEAFDTGDYLLNPYNMEEAVRRFVAKRPDGKVIKSPSYSPAVLQGILYPDSTIFRGAYNKLTLDLAAEFYNTYCESVGWKNFKGDPLPNWLEFANDPKKEKQARGWCEVAKKAINTEY